MGRLPEKIRSVLATTLFDWEIDSIEGRTADEYCAEIEGIVASHRRLDIEVAGYPDHTANLAACLRELLAIGEIDAAIRVAIHLGEVMADDEAHSHLFWYRGKRAVESGNKSAAATWGPPEQRTATLAERRRLFDLARPGYESDQETFEAVAKRCGVSWRTIRRAVTGH